MGTAWGGTCAERDESLRHGLKRSSVDGTEAMTGFTLLLHGGGKASGIERAGWKAWASALKSTHLDGKPCDLFSCAV